MKTIPGMFENPAQAKYYKNKNQRYYDIISNNKYIPMRRKIIDDYCL